MNDYDFFNWYNSEATPEEKAVANKVGMLEELFADMVFAPNTRTSSFLVCQTKTNETDVWGNNMIDIPEAIEYFSPTDYKIRVKELHEAMGQFNIATQELTISPQHIDSESVILHEMIHMYENMLENQMPFYRDIIFYALYTDLRKQIPTLDKILIDHANVLNQLQMNQIGGIHDILFILKSFDLDIRQGYQLGTVFGYGMQEELTRYE